MNWRPSSIPIEQAASAHDLDCPVVGWSLARPKPFHDESYNGWMRWIGRAGGMWIWA